ncbi:MAG: phosphatase PAP2 family protein [Planctomycetes bacterium]|nr:phosphatase PAP2 family protein [Planctomycetota bacterium]
MKDKKSLTSIHHSAFSIHHFLERLLAALDRVPGLGGGITHLVFLSLFFGTSLMLYLTVLRLRGPAVAFRTRVAWDTAFPFTPWWVWIYLLPYVLGPLLTIVMSRAAFAWYVRRGTLVVLVSLVIFAAVPTQTVRPLQDDPANEERLGAGWTADLYRWMVEIDDPPANAAPSLHVSLSCLLAWAMAYDFPRWRAAAAAGAMVIWLSTLFTAQHHLIDVVTGALLASLAAIGGPHRGGRSPSL